MENTATKNNVLIILLIIMIVGMGVLTYLFITERHSHEETIMGKENVEEEKAELEVELNEMYDVYDALKSENEDINEQLTKQQERIKTLLAYNAANTQKVKMYQKELKTLREVMRSYIIQIDSLNRRNQLLTAENIETKNQLRTVSEDKQELEKEAEQLSEKVTMASVLAAKNMYVAPLNDRGKEKDKVKKVVKLRTCFTVRENNIVPKGEKFVFLRIVRPDGIVLSNPDAATIAVNGQQIAYSAQRMLEYEGQDIDMCIYWDNDGSLIPGTYEVYLYESGNMIGSTTFALTEGVF